MPPRPASHNAALGLAVAVALCVLPAGAEEEAAGAAPAVETTAAELRDRALADGRSYELLRSLTVEVGHRFAGSDGDRRAVEWALGKMRDLGLANVRAEPVTVPRWVRGRAAGAILEPWPQPVMLIALGGSVGTPGEGVEAEVVRVASLADLAERPAAEIAGKIVFIDQRMERHRAGAGYGQTAGIRRDGPSKAAEKGAAALLIRSLATGTHRFPHTGSLKYAEDVRRIPAAALAVPDADLLAAQIASGRPVRFRLELGCRYLGEAESANVIGEVVGRERPEEIVLLGAHLDSWDVGTGAHDDGSGCATVMAAASLIAERPHPPRRTVRVVLFANEEFGLSGAFAYADAHADEIAEHQAAIESDFGAGRIWRFATRMNPAALPAAESFAAVLEPLGVEWHGNEARGGADLIPLRGTGVPFADLTQDGTLYFDYHHAEDDTLDKVDPEALAQNLAAYTAFAWFAADTEADFRPAPAPAER